MYLRGSEMLAEQLQERVLGGGGDDAGGMGVCVGVGGWYGVVVLVCVWGVWGVGGWAPAADYHTLARVSGAPLRAKGCEVTVEGVRVDLQGAGRA